MQSEKSRSGGIFYTLKQNIGEVSSRRLIYPTDGVEGAFRTLLSKYFAILIFSLTFF